MKTTTRFYLRMILKAFGKRASRVLIASLSVIVGAATLCTLGLLAYAVPEQLNAELRSSGANMVVIPRTADLLTDTDVEMVDEAAGESVITSAAYRYTNLVYSQQSISTMAVDLDDVVQVRPYWQVDGDYPAAREILIGEDVATRYNFRRGDVLTLTHGESEEGQSARLTVSGILRTGGAEDDQAVISFDTLSSLTEDDGYSIIEYSIDGNEQQIDSITEEINQHETNAEAENVRRVSQAESGITQTLRQLIWLVAGIISILTLISVMSTQVSMVRERAKEFGLKRALGALTNDILKETVGETVLLGLVGGGVGSLLGIWIANEVSRQVFATDLTINWWVIPITLVFSLLVAIIGSLAPARRIAQIEPVRVLGGE